MDISQEVPEDSSQLLTLNLNQELKVDSIHHQTVQYRPFEADPSQERPVSNSQQLAVQYSHLQVVDYSQGLLGTNSHLPELQSSLGQALEYEQEMSIYYQNSSLPAMHYSQALADFPQEVPSNSSQQLQENSSLEGEPSHLLADDSSQLLVMQDDGTMQVIKIKCSNLKDILLTVLYLT
jgi:hypothetical protein